MQQQMTSLLSAYYRFDKLPAAKVAQFYCNKCKKLSLSTTNNSEMTHRKQEKITNGDITSAALRHCHRACKVISYHGSLSHPSAIPRLLSHEALKSVQGSLHYTLVREEEKQ